MSKYKITIEEITPSETSAFPRSETLYEQTVEGEDTIIQSVMKTVLDYIECGGN
jgi:hypothetical protein